MNAMSLEQLQGIVKSCGRCSTKINCMANNELPCECSKLSLSTETMEFLKKTSYDCLCNQCLKELDSLVAIKIDKNGKLIENLHFYYEDAYVVFKELYHIQRGHCCKSNCRHCAYAFKLLKG